MRKKFTLSNIYSSVFAIYLLLFLVGTISKIRTNYLVLLFTSVLIVFLSTRNISKHFLWHYLFIGFYCIYGIMTILLHGGGLGGILSIVSGVIVCLGMQRVYFSRRMFGCLAVVLFLCLVIWLVRSPIWYDLFFYNQWKGDGTVTNANGVGHYICYNSILLFIIMGYSRSGFIRKIRWCLFPVAFWGIYNVKARMCLAVLCVFFFLNLIVLICKRHRKSVIKLSLVGAIICEAIFPFLYLYMYRNQLFMGISMFGRTEKGLYTGRQDIWLAAFQNMKGVVDWLFGVGSHQNYWVGHVLNMHNNVMDLLVVVGILGTLVYLVYLVRFIFKYFDFVHSSVFQVQCLVFFISILLEGCTDITIFYNDFLPYYFIPLGIALNEKYKHKGEKYDEICNFNSIGL